MEAVNINFKVIGLTQLGIKPESIAPEADALSARPSKLLEVSSEQGCPGQKAREWATPLVTRFGHVPLV